jgi:tRNA nucleotidyltransferase (CCA-adding enzyme)
MSKKIELDIPEFVSFILKRLKDAGHQAFVVGGAVRDSCLKRPTLDWDVVTSAIPQEIGEVFKDTHHFFQKHGTVTLVNSGNHFEVTPFRGKKQSLIEDLSLRDFTINAMAFDPEADKIIDPLAGMGDISKRLIRAVRDPEARFREDPLRLLRAVRFSTELGFHIEKRTLNSLSLEAQLLNSVAPERIREELMKILMSRKPSTGFNLMVRTGLLRHFLPELLEGYLKRQNTYYHRYTIFKHIMETVDKVAPDPVLRLTALLHDIAKPRVRKKIEGVWRFYGHEQESSVLATEIMDRLKFNKEMTRKVTSLIRHHMIAYDTGWSDAAVRRLVRRVGPEYIPDFTVFVQADIIAHGTNNKDLNLIKDLMKRIENQVKGHMARNTRDLALDGHEIMKILGLPPGPAVGRTMENLLEKITDHPELNTREALLGLLEERKRKKSDRLA